MKYHNIPTLFDNQASLINGKNIGTDSVRYIQDAGQKTAGTTYIDRNTNELYVCVTTTDSVNNDGNFSKFNLKEAFNKLDNFVFEECIVYENYDLFSTDITIAYNSQKITLNDNTLYKFINIYGGSGGYVKIPLYVIRNLKKRMAYSYDNNYLHDAIQSIMYSNGKIELNTTASDERATQIPPVYKITYSLN